jgi:DNA-binding NarL/FixJ family response regulator
MAGVVKGRSRRAAARVRLVIVDDHGQARAGTRELLGTAHGVEVVGEAVNGHDAIGLCRRLRPDLVLMDVQLRDMDGMAATRAIRAAVPETRVLLITMFEASEYANEALRAGAEGLVRKGAPRGELLMALRDALSGAGVAGLRSRLAP